MTPSQVDTPPRKPGRQSSADPIRTTAPFVYNADALRTYLTNDGCITHNDWLVAQELHKQSGSTHLKALLDVGVISEDTLSQKLAACFDCARWSPDNLGATELFKSVPIEFMRTSGVLVLETQAEELDEQIVTLVISDPSDQFTLSSLFSRFGPLARVQIATHKQIIAFLDAQAERSTDEDTDPSAVDTIDVTGELSALRDMASEAPVVRFFNQTAERAMDLGASDIHIERFDRRVSLRLRVDGMLIDQPPPPLRMYDAIMCRIKIMAKLDIAERRRAQDGRIQMRLRGRSVDMRISIVPTMYGQDAAIRIQDRQKLADIELASLGFSKQHIDALTTTAARSHGILLITGPTGSGKTTTLYALLRTLVATERKTVTVEDPVEYAMDGVNQIQVNPAINLSFSNTLRHILRHDPDVILIGEIRDKETAEIAFQASLTGHMVLSTLHTNDVAGTFVRLIDMGVEPYLVNAAVEGVSAQRLVRKLYTACNNTLPARESCKTCGGLGYRGRQAIMEFSRLPTAVKRLLLDGAEEHRIRAALLDGNFAPLRTDAQRLVDSGLTDTTEVTRVLGRQTDLDEDTPT